MHLPQSMYPEFSSSEKVWGQMEMVYVEPNVITQQRL